jgi:hypothetical protein
MKKKSLKRKKLQNNNNNNNNTLILKKAKKCVQSRKSWKFHTYTPTKKNAKGQYHSRNLKNTNKT